MSLQKIFTCILWFLQMSPHWLRACDWNSSPVLNDYLRPSLFSYTSKACDCYKKFLTHARPFFDLHLFWPVVDLLPHTLGYVPIFIMWLSQKFLTPGLNCSWIATSDTPGHFPICRKHVTVAGKFLALAHRPQVASDPSIHSLTLSSQNTKSVVAGPLCFPDNTRLCIFQFQNIQTKVVGISFYLNLTLNIFWKEWLKQQQSKLKYLMPNLWQVWHQTIQMLCFQFRVHSNRVNWGCNNEAPPEWIM